jgi:hypothetical protein
MFRYNRILRFILASKYSHNFAYKYSILMQNIQVEANIRLTFSHIGKYLLQNIPYEANIRKTLSKFHIQANIRLQIFAYKRIFACKYSHTRKYSPRIASS